MFIFGFTYYNVYVQVCEIKMYFFFKSHFAIFFSGCLIYAHSGASPRLSSLFLEMSKTLWFGPPTSLDECYVPSTGWLMCACSVTVLPIPPFPILRRNTLRPFINTWQHSPAMQTCLSWSWYLNLQPFNWYPVITFLSSFCTACVYPCQMNAL